MRKRRPSPRRREAPRWTPAEWADGTTALLRRCGSRCERCGHDLCGRGERHHRVRREQGGDRLANLVLLHPDCHAWCHAHPAEARTLGLIVSVSEDPAAVPVVVAGAAWVLDDEGGKTRWSPAREGV